ncbi:hypothetical protein H0H93_005731 [Arthromyces matolae]|nr:hypothetical protein H0H93_005731 [Arthromyces matolae]
MLSVKRVGVIIERVYGGDGLTIACQDGKAAGQSVPHVHFHILPRKKTGDRFSDRNDEIYPALEGHEGSLNSDLAATQHSSVPLKVDADEDRRPRTLEEMEKEATWLKSFFDSQHH